MSSEYPLVSIALCTYNGGRHLKELLDGLVLQSYPNIEIVITDDRSTDDTPLVIEGYMAQYPFIIYERNDVNLGYVKNFEKAIRKCKGEFIALADQDDIWSPEKIASMVAEIGTHALAYHDSELIDEKGATLQRRISSLYNMYSGNQPYPFFFWNCISGHAMLFNRSLIDKFLPFHPSHYHDWQIAIVATINGGVKYMPKVFVKYRQHEANATDILNAKPKTTAHIKSLFNEQSFEFLTFLLPKMGKHRSFVNDLLSCFNSQHQIIHRFKLLRLLLSKYDLLLFRSKKSKLSKLNFVKRAVLSKV